MRAGHVESDPAVQFQSEFVPLAPAEISPFVSQ